MKSNIYKNNLNSAKVKYVRESLNNTMLTYNNNNNTWPTNLNTKNTKKYNYSH